MAKGLIVFVSALLLAPFAMAQVRSVPIGAHIDWNRDRDGDVARYRSGGVALTIRARAEGETWVPVLTVEMPGQVPVSLEGAATGATFSHRVTVGRWDAQRPYVMFQSFTGGAHCCNHVQIVLPEGGVLRVVDLGPWDGDYIETLPSDRDGDGQPDFVFADNNFLYRFSSYAESYPPPQVINIVGGEAVDVSDRPSFRPLFEAARRDARQLCIEPGEWARNGACAAFVAAAARVGRLDEAWAEMLRAYDRTSDWGVEGICRIPLVDGDCPPGQQQDFADYPEALRQFLIDTGYIGVE